MKRDAGQFPGVGVTRQQLGKPMRRPFGGLGEHIAQALGLGRRFAKSAVQAVVAGIETDALTSYAAKSLSEQEVAVVSFGHGEGTRREREHGAALEALYLGSAHRFRWRIIWKRHRHRPSPSVFTSSCVRRALPAPGPIGCRAAPARSRRG